MSYGFRWVLAALCVTAWAGPVRAAESMSDIVGEPPAFLSIEPAEDVSGAPEDEVEPVRVSMDFEGATLTTVLKSFSQQTGINVIATDEVGERPITLFLEDVSVLDAFDQILRAGELTYERPEGSDIYIVSSVEDEDAVETITRIYRVRYARVSSSLLAQAAATLIAGTPFEAAGGVTGEGGSGGGGGGGQVGIDLLVQELLTDHGKVVVDSRTNSLMVTDVPGNFPRIEAVLAALDVRTPQILVDTEIIETSMAKLKHLGFEWGTGDSGDAFTFTPGGERTTRFPFNALTEHYVPTASGSPLSASTLSFESFTGVLQALQQDTDSKVLARPKVLTLDNEAAIIRLTADEAIGFEVTTSGGTDQTQVEPIRATTGVVMAVTPQINDNGFITMIVEPSVTKTVASKVSPPAGTGDVRDPKTRNSRTIVRVRNGDTLVVGGLIDRTDETVNRSVPVLSGIPFVGEAFKKEQVNDNATELIVFVTPRIIAEGPETQVAAATPGTGGAQTPPEFFGDREQERDGGARQESIEEALNRLDEPVRD